MPTIKDVAARAGVSIGTVSNVLTGSRPVSNPVAERVHEAIASLEYSPNFMARSLRGARTQIIGLVVPDNANPFFAELAWSIEQACTQAGLSLILCNTGRSIEREWKSIEILLEKRVEGIIVATSTNHSALAKVAKRKLPLVVIDHDAGGIAADAVLVDHRDGGELVARHLMGLEHRRIACITGLPAQSNASRVSGLRAALAVEGVELPDTLIRESDTHADGGYRVTREMFANDPAITAVFAANDLVALGAIRALYDIGLSVPGDVSVVGYDDISIASQVLPRLTTIRQPMEEISRRAITILEQRIDAPERPVERIMLPVELIVRETTTSSRAPP